MKQIIPLLLSLIAFNFSFAQQSDLKTWAVMKEIIGMETTAAETLIKSHGYKYDRSFEGLGLNFKEYRFDKWKTSSLYKLGEIDGIKLGSRDGKIEFIEFPDQDLIPFEKELTADNFEMDIIYREDYDKTKIKTFFNSAKSIKVRMAGLKRTALHPDNLFIYKGDIPLCFPSVDDVMKYGSAVTHREMIEDDMGIETFAYTDYLQRMSCSQNDTKATVAEKILLMWNLFGDKFNVNFPGFNLENENIIFYGVKMTFEVFLLDMYKTYQLDINLKYLFNGEKEITILDFSRTELENAKKEIPISQEKLKAHQRVYKLLRELGAKHSEEL